MICTFFIMSSTKPLITAAQGGADPSGEQTATSGKNRLTGYNVYNGVVVTSDLVTRKLAVLVEKVVISNCIYAPGAVASFMGFTTVALPPVGSPVLLMYLPHTSYVLGTQPLSFDSTEQFSGSIAGDIQEAAADMDAFAVATKGDKATTAPGYAAPRDLLPGENSIENNMGVVLRMLFNMEQMAAGDLAKVEVHMLNDMVRIIDNYFVHHNVGGDTLIWSNGRCNYESHFTGYPHEAEGKEKETDALAEPVGPNIVDPIEATYNPYSDTGRWRKSTYVGFLADMIHTWVTDPTAVLSTYGEDSFRAGKYRSWVGSDGTVMVQTVAGVQIEVVPRIVIPAMTAKWDDPSVDAAKQVEDLNKEFLKMWGKGPNWADLSVACWQMRTYAKYIALFHSLSRFKQLEEKKGCVIPTEKESPAPKPTSDETDKEQVNPEGDTPYNNHAIFCMDPSGSISLIANGSTSIVLNQGNLQFSAPGNVEIQAGGTLSLTGKSVIIKALHHVEISAIAGSLWLKARTSWNALCEAGRMWLKSDAKPEHSANKEKTDANYPVKDGQPINPESGNFGVVIDSSQSKVLVHGYKGVTAGSTGEDAPVQVQATGGKSYVSLFSRTDVKIAAAAQVLIKGIKFAVASTVSKITSQTIKFGEKVLIHSKGMEVGGVIRTQRVGAVGGFSGPIDKVNKYKEAKDVTPNPASPDADKVGAEAEAQTEKNLTFAIMADELSKYSWRYSSWSIGGNVLNWDSLKAPALHDAISMSEFLKDKYSMVLGEKCALIPSGGRTTPSTPWPGKNAKYFEFSKKDTAMLGTIWDKHFTEDMIATAGDMTAGVYKLYFQK